VSSSDGRRGLGRRGASSVPLPRAAALALWGAEYLAGRESPDDAAARVSARTEQTGEDPFEVLVGLRDVDSPSLRLLLPVPGRLEGLVGPPATNDAALAAGQAVLVTSGPLADRLLVPTTLVHGPEEGADEADRTVAVAWQTHPTDSRAVPSGVPAAEARRRLQQVMTSAAGTVQDLGLVPEDFTQLDALPDDWARTSLPRSVDVPTGDYLLLAAEVLLLARTALAGADEPAGGAGAGAWALGQREQIMRELADAARTALTATVDAVVGQSPAGRT
jgi:hypothetical protein